MATAAGRSPFGGQSLRLPDVTSVTPFYGILPGFTGFFSSTDVRAQRKRTATARPLTTIWWSILNIIFIARVSFWFSIFSYFPCSKNYSSFITRFYFLTTGNKKSNLSSVQHRILLGFKIKSVIRPSLSCTPKDGSIQKMSLNWKNPACFW